MNKDIFDDFPIHLNEQEKDDFLKGLDSLLYHSEEELIEEYKEVFNDIRLPLPNTELKDFTKEEVFFYLISIGSYNLLCFAYFKSLKENDPKVLLNGFYSFNHLESTCEIESGYDHCIGLKPVLMCYAGNNLNLVQYYLPNEIQLAKKGHNFLITAINLIIAIRDSSKETLVLEQTLKFLNKKNTKFEIEVVLTLKAILEKNAESISEHLNTVTKLHKSSTWLHQFNNKIAKSLPSISYGLYSIAYHHLEPEIFSKISLPTEKIWWNHFALMNMENKFTPGSHFVKFEGDLNFINEIENKLQLKNKTY